MDDARQNDFRANKGGHLIKAAVADAERRLDNLSLAVDESEAEVLVDVISADVMDDAMNRDERIGLRKIVEFFAGESPCIRQRLSALLGDTNFGDMREPPRTPVVGSKAADDTVARTELQRTVGPHIDAFLHMAVQFDEKGEVPS